MGEAITRAPPTLRAHYLRVGTSQGDGKDLLDRLDQVMAALGWSASEWCRQAGMSIDALHVLRHRIESGRGAGITLATADALARSAGVSLEWIASGRGPMAPAPADPSRAAAIAAARLLGYSEEAISAVAAEPQPEIDPGTDHWLRRLQRHQAAALARLVDADLSSAADHDAD